jgi:hypothetical protein
MQAHALTLICYLHSLNVIITHPIVYKEGLSYLGVCAISLQSPPPSHMYLQWSSKLLIIQCMLAEYLVILIKHFIVYIWIITVKKFFMKFEMQLTSDLNHTFMTENN